MNRFWLKAARSNFIRSYVQLTTLTSTVTKWPFTFRLSAEAQAEARMLMLASGNILNPKDGKPVVTPSQDMVLGSFYLTMDNKDAKGTGMIFGTVHEAISSYQRGNAHLHARVAIPAKALEQNKLYGRTAKCNA